MLLRSAYRPLAEMGMNYSAAVEDVEATKANIADGECYIGLLDGKLIGTVILRLPVQNPPLQASLVTWYSRPGTANFGRLAIDPSFQGKKLASQMMDHIEFRARALGYAELALDTSEKAVHLIRLYMKRGYRLVDHHQWSDKSYRSVILSKKLIFAGTSKI